MIPSNAQEFAIQHRGRQGVAKKPEDYDGDDLGSNGENSSTLLPCIRSLVGSVIGVFCGWEEDKGISQRSGKMVAESLSFPSSQTRRSTGVFNPFLFTANPLLPCKKPEFAMGQKQAELVMQIGNRGQQSYDLIFPIVCSTWPCCTSPCFWQKRA